jgi:hypothetical protein
MQIYPTLDDVRSNPNRLADPRFRSNRVAYDGRTRLGRMWKRFYNEHLAAVHRELTPSVIEAIKEMADRSVRLEIGRMRQSRGLPVDEDALAHDRGQQHRARMSLGMLPREGSPSDPEYDLGDVLRRSP